MKPHGDGRLGAAQRASDLAAVEVFPDREEQDLSISLWQELQRHPDRLTCLRFDGPGLCRLRALLEQSFRERFLPKRSAPNVEPHVSRDADEPRPLFVRHHIEPAPGDQKRFGDNIVRDLRVAAPRITADGLDVRRIEQVEPFFSREGGSQGRPPGG